MSNDSLTITILGSGTSTGVPQIGCTCPVCLSADPRDKRLRQSALVTYRGTNILIDCGPDFRQQILSAGSPHLDAVLLTHIHYDHIGGLEELRSGDSPRIYARADVINALKQRLAYCFARNPYPGAPQFKVSEVVENQPFDCNGVAVTPIPFLHGTLPILGYRIGPLAYLTDCKSIAGDTVAGLHGVPLLVINALRYEEHPTHLSLSQALALVERINPGKAVLVHMSHGIGLHTRTSQLLPPGVVLAYDGLTVTA